MPDVVEYVFGAASFVPHGVCLLWRPDLVAMHALSDGAIAASYFSIPMALAVFVRRRMDLEYKWVFWLFVAFIVACGTTHLVDVVTLWQPAYGLQGLIKIATAGLSVTTAFLLWPLIPKALALPSPSALRKANAELEKALIEKDRALRQISALLDSAPDATLFVNRIGTIVAPTGRPGASWVIQRENSSLVPSSNGDNLCWIIHAYNAEAPSGTSCCRADFLCGCRPCGDKGVSILSRHLPNDK